MTKTTMMVTTETTKIKFTKMTGTGNDFLIIDARLTGPNSRFISKTFDRGIFVRNVCRRSLSIGADGVVFLEEPTQPLSVFKWDFYNADGSNAEMCGNASRCVARYALEKKISQNAEVIFETRTGLIKTKVLDGIKVEVEMPPPKLIEREVEVLVGEHVKISVMVIDTGVPHVVKENDQWDDEYLVDIGGFLRRHETFKKFGGANATFFEVSGSSKIQSVTYERGVEGLTMACGTGAVAAAVAAVVKKKMESPIEVLVPGGVLEVKVSSDLKSAALIGEARFICEGIINTEALL